MCNQFSLGISWQWLKRAGLKCQTESLINYCSTEPGSGYQIWKSKVKLSREPAMCRMCSSYVLKTSDMKQRYTLSLSAVNWSRQATKPDITKW